MVPPSLILDPLLFNIFINNIFSFLTTCEMCNYADGNTLYIYRRNFHQVKEYLQKGLEVLENWFFDNYMVLNPRKYEFMGFGKISENEILIYHEILLKETTTKKLLGITIEEHLISTSIVIKSASRKLNALSRVSSLLSYQQKKVVSNSLISGPFDYCLPIWMSSFINFYRKINKLYERSLRLCHHDYTSSYDKTFKQTRLSKHSRKKYSILRSSNV